MEALARTDNGGSGANGRPAAVLAMRHIVFDEGRGSGEMVGVILQRSYHRGLGGGFKYVFISPLPGE